MKPRFTDSHKYPHGYTPAAATDITKTLERARKRIEQQQAATARKVTPMDAHQGARQMNDTYHCPRCGEDFPSRDEHDFCAPAPLYVQSERARARDEQEGNYDGR